MIIPKSFITDYLLFIICDQQNDQSLIANIFVVTEMGSLPLLQRSKFTRTVHPAFALLALKSKLQLQAVACVYLLNFDATQEPGLAPAAHLQ